MRVALVYEQLVDNKDGLNGVSLQIGGLIRYLKEREHSVALLSTDDAANVVPHLGVDFHTKAPTLPLKGFDTPVPSPLTEFRFLSEVVQDDDETVVIIGNLCLNAISVVTQCRLRGIPCAIFAHCDVYDYVRIRCTSTLEFFLWKTFLWLVHFYIHRLLRVPTLSRSRAMLPVLQTSGCGPHFYIVPGGADDQVFQCFTSSVRKPKSLLFVGRISIEKNIDQLLEIMKELGNEYTLTLAGRICEDEYGNAEKFVQLLPNNTLWVGEVPHGKPLVELYNTHEAFLFASEFDTFGNVVVEALLCGCTPIVKDCLGPGEIVQHEISGFKYKTTAEAVACIRDSHRPPAWSMVARGKEFSSRRSWERLETVCEQLIKKKKRCLKRKKVT